MRNAPKAELGAPILFIGEILTSDFCIPTSDFCILTSDFFILTSAF